MLSSRPSRCVAALAASAAVLLPACSSPPQPTIEIYADSACHALARDFAGFVPYEELRVTASGDPVAEVASAAADIAIALVADLDCTECYRLERAGPFRPGPCPAAG